MIFFLTHGPDEISAAILFKITTGPLDWSRLPSRVWSGVMTLYILKFKGFMVIKEKSGGYKVEGLFVTNQNLVTTTQGWRNPLGGTPWSIGTHKKEVT
ncbi:hypothetical protein HanRHA438_Chr07g0314751 [Helianthus annuus]|nr:hypothetical protein HanRHA438_Chr07g0314751 [Helianthus annuus]